MGVYIGVPLFWETTPCCTVAVWGLGVGLRVSLTKTGMVCTLVVELASSLQDRKLLVFLNEPCRPHVSPRGSPWCPLCFRLCHLCNSANYFVTALLICLYLKCGGA